MRILLRVRGKKCIFASNFIKKVGDRMRTTPTEMNINNFDYLLNKWNIANYCKWPYKPPSRLVAKL